MRAVSALRRLPGSAVLLPLTAGIAVAAVTGGRSGLGPFTTGMSGGAISYVSLLLVCIGAQISPGSLRPVASRIAVVLAGATLIPGVGALVYARLAGRDGIDGVSSLAVAAAAVCTSNALWLVLARRYGSDTDAWGGAVASILNSAPIAPMLILAAVSRHHALPWCGMIDALAPLAVGVVVGRLAPACRTALAAAVPLLVVALSFGLGTQVQVRHLGGQLVAGAVLGVAVALVSGGLVAAGWRIVLHRPATVGFGAAACTVAVPLTPSIVAAADPTWAPLVPAATAQLAVALIVSTLAAPALTAAVHAWTLRAHHRPAHLAGHPRPATSTTLVPRPARGMPDLIPIDHT
ncbi:2-keto-3-deoxygluconate permease [Actinocatenispora comari]|uniref:2-keto-3-deoxygluconate permease n=1 Tax=Actinocatenispora comari TaxID=2807577 RepID=A0A8J4AD28_9ACTN|nr:2-keto-3-deoxygluconate permease [Actinocatenispora comari]GIL29071.1 2-keto-3-deoxygluconate permease [Actinocatenispora comari]